MAKVKAYIRVGEFQKSDGKWYKVTASESPNKEPLKRGTSNLPTAAFAIELDIPDSQFRLAEQVLATIEVAESTEMVAAEVTYLDG